MVEEIEFKKERENSFLNWLKVKENPNWLVILAIIIWVECAYLSYSRYILYGVFLASCLFSYALYLSGDKTNE